MTISHPEHQSGHILYIRQGDIFYTATYSCKMAECNCKFIHMWGQQAKSVIVISDHLAVETLQSASEQRAASQRAYRRNLPYFSFLCNDGSRPTIAPDGILKRKPIPSVEAILLMTKLGLVSGVSRFAKSKLLMPVSSGWDKFTTTKVKDVGRIKEALADIGVINGRLTGQARERSPEDLANAFQLQLEGVDPGQVLS